ncbi:LiaF transmembrane domain-containing protein [Clostridium chrysemydis]|uniref:LiaF transmembrane domain-containing protein n=1 Tax=Clostridium chrysemydis TaxID=2665504 RepID=UPI001884584E|nr:hypothetical protein [Clostridium chrysemydis]
MKKDRVLFGIILILGSIFMILSKLGYFEDFNIFYLFLSGVFLFVSIRSLFRKNFYGVFFPLAFIGIIYSKQLGITDITPGPILIAAALLSLGLSLIFKKPKYVINNGDYDKIYEDVAYEDSEYINLNTSFGSSIKYINTDNFKCANLSCSFGSMKLYFDNASILNDSAVLKLDVSFGGVEIFVPKDWYIDDKTSVSFGGLTEKNKGDRNTSKTLILTGDISFSGVDIIYI